MKAYKADHVLSDFYSKIHQERSYYGSAWKSDVRKMLISKVTYNLQDGSEVLDLGCRDGVLSADLLKSFKITGIDIDSAAILQYKKRLKKNNLDVDVIVADLNKEFPLKNMCFHAVVGGEIIEHLINPRSFLREIKRVLRSDGVFVGSTPNAARLDKRLKLFLGKDPKEFSDPTHLQYFNKTTLETLLHSEFSCVELFSYKNKDIIRILPKIFADGFVFICRP